MEIIIIIAVFVLFFSLLLGIGKRRLKQPPMYYYPNKRDLRVLEITSDERGTQSERDLISALLNYGISPRAIFHDLYVKNGTRNFSQIDVVVATRVGIIVFEVKDYSGWIFGKGRQNQWTQVLNYGATKNRFYNPVLQNASHIRALQKQSSQFKNLPFYSVIVFAGNCELRDITFIPEGTFVIRPYRLNDVLDIIFDNDDAQYTNKHEVMRILKDAVNNGTNNDTLTEHIENIRDMLGKDRVLD